MLVVCGYTLLTDVLSFGFVYQRYLESSLSYMNLISLRGLSMVAVSTVPPLAPLVPIGYFRRKGVKVSKVISAELLVTLIDILGGVSVLCLTLLLLAGGKLQEVFVSLSSILFIGLCVPLIFSRLRGSVQLEKVSILECFFTIDRFNFFRIYIVRLGLLAAHVVAISIMLPLLSINLALWQAIIFSPLFVASAFLPISIGGYGGPQGVAVVLLAQIWQVTDIEGAIAFSILWSTLFLLGRSSVGGIFAAPLVIGRGQVQLIGG